MEEALDLSFDRLLMMMMMMMMYTVGMIDLKNARKMFLDKPERRAKFGGSDLKHSFLCSCLLRQIFPAPLHHPAATLNFTARSICISTFPASSSQPS